MTDDGHQDLWARAVIEQNQRWLTAYFLASTGDRNTADDLVQEVFHQAFTSQHNYDRDKPFGAWLRGIARHLLFRHYRNSKRQLIPLGDKVVERLEAVAAEAEHRQIDPDWQPTRLVALKDCLGELTERVRAMLTLKYQEELASKDIADRFRMKTNAVDMAMSRARRVLEDCVSRKMGQTYHE
ncbi:MAG TPA: sigma-70 family RNA polymerase sigma factor [Planctomycetota bacterium]|nr:sigma-70 family RNA polymerase sigma factor [Planctomycetota bacterium]